MPDQNELEERMRKFAEVRKLFGPVKKRAVPVFEDCLNYPIDKVVSLVRLSWEAGRLRDDMAETKVKIDEFERLLDSIEPVENPVPRVYLWDGNMPAETEYTDNSDCRYHHDPDFKPYFFPVLVPEDVEPKGAVILCAGGDHAEAVVSEAYGSALDFGALGYQCFILLNRTNMNPWSSREAGVDAARMVRIVRRDAEKYRVRPDQIAFAGFSNGGLTGEGLIEHFSGSQTVKDAFPDYIPDRLDEIDATPDAFLCVYGPRFRGAPFDYENVVYPPTFFAVGREDRALDNLEYVYPDLLAHGVEVEIHTFAGTPHGQAGVHVLDGYVKYPNFQMWVELADAFMQNIYKRKR